ncbi:MAG TPA: histidine kinase [Candidatus Polarisedimenticolaceae bacterium]|nr:histidine kinase [Candidatus Polarisedimenticolaceae bacterium]
MTGLRLLELIVSVCGICSFGALLVLCVRDLLRPTERTSVGSAVFDVALTAVCFTWFAIGALLAVAPPDAEPWLMQTIQLGITCLFPPLIMHSVWLELRDRAAAAAPWRLTIGATYLTSAGLFVFGVLGFYRKIAVATETVSSVVTVGLGALFLGCAVYSVAATRRFGARPESSARRSARLSVFVLYGAVAAFSLLLVLAGLGRIQIDELIGLVGRGLPLLFLLVLTWFENRFQFVDLFVKRGASLLVTLLLSAVALAAALRALAWIEPIGLRAAVVALLLLPLALALPAGLRRLEARLDRAWFGRRFTSEEALTRFLSSLRSATSEAELIASAERELGAIFQAPVRIDPAGAEPETPGFTVARQAAVELEGTTAATIRIGPRAGEMPFFSTDVALLDSLAAVFGSLLENVRLQQRRQELSLDASRSELKALRAQVNPHFLFNALNAIAGLIPTDPQKADRTIEQLADVFRYTLRRSENEWARLEDELAFCRAYLDVEQARFGSRLETALHSEAGLETARIPTMAVQTLVENAVKHGVAAVRGPGRIEIAARGCDGRLIVEVADSGPGFATNGGSARGEGYGLQGLRRRLAGYFGDAAALSVGRDETRGMTVVTLELPLGSG